MLSGVCNGNRLGPARALSGIVRDYFQLMISYLSGPTPFFIVNISEHGRLLSDNSNPRTSVFRPHGSCSKPPSTAAASPRGGRNVHPLRVAAKALRNSVVTCMWRGTGSSLSASGRRFGPDCQGWALCPGLRGICKKMTVSNASLMTYCA